MTVKVDLDKMTIRLLGDKILKKEFCMIAPDVEIDDGKGTIIISSEEGETDDIADKLLKDFSITEGSRLKCDDFLQNYKLNITIAALKVNEENRDKIGEIYEIIGDRSQLNPQEETPSTSGSTPSEVSINVTGDLTVVDNDELQILEQPDDIQVVGIKRQLPSSYESLPAKKRRVVTENEDEEMFETVDID
jgi:ubiquitin-like 1-activating enzyme E1 B